MTWAYTIETGTTDLPQLQEPACWETTTTAESRVEFHYNWNRYYDPGLGMYTQVDKVTAQSAGLYLRQVARTPQKMSSYLYAVSSPLKNLDWNGLEPFSEDFWEEYLNYRYFGTSDVWEAVGGNLGNEYGPDSNSCAARLSYGLNRGGEPIPRGAPGANRNYNGDNQRYILSARKMREYLSNRWGQPDASLRSGDRNGVKDIQNRLKKDQVAVVASDGHISVVKKDYSDPYVSGFGGDVWYLPTKP